MSTTIFICGPKRDHECNADGPEICGGEDKVTGEPWQGEATVESRKRATWGSVSCSICGMTSTEKGMWQ